jgi:hypothetical protein
MQVFYIWIYGCKNENQSPKQAMRHEQDRATYIKDVFQNNKSHERAAEKDFSVIDLIERTFKTIEY